MCDATARVQQKIHGWFYGIRGYLCNKKVRLIAFYALAVCAVLVFIPLLFEAYRAFVIQSVETFVMHRALRKYDKWDKMLLLFGLRGCALILLLFVLFRIKCQIIKAFIKVAIKHKWIPALAVSMLYIVAISICFLLKSNAVQSCLIFVGEHIRGRALDHTHWHRALENVVLLLPSAIFLRALLICGTVAAWLYDKDQKDISKQCTSIAADKAVMIICSACTFFVAILTIDGGQGWGGDFAEYIAQARAICTGTVAEQVRNNTFIIKNSTPLGPETYPWGFPLMLAPVYALFGENLFALKIPGVLCFVMFAVYCYKLMRKSFGIFVSFIVTMCFAINRHMLGMANGLYADMAFLGMSTTAVYYLTSLFDTNNKENSRKNQIAIGALAGFFMFCASSIRPNGIALLCTLFAMHILIFVRKSKSIDVLLFRIGMPHPARFCPTAHILPYFIFAVGIIAISILFPTQAKAHTDFLRTITRQSICRNAIYYAHISKTLFPFSADFSAELYGIFVLFFIYGFCRHLMRHAHLMICSIYIVCTLAIYILWPFLQGIRFIFPILPLCTIFVGLGIHDAAAALSGKTRAAMTIAGLILMISYAKNLPSGSIIYGQKRNKYGAYTDETAAIYKYLREYTKPSDIVIFIKPRVLYLETGRLGFQTEDISRLKEANYLLLLRNSYGFDYDIESQYPTESKALQLVMEGKSLKLYKINKGYD